MAAANARRSLSDTGDLTLGKCVRASVPYLAPGKCVRDGPGQRPHGTRRAEPKIRHNMSRSTSSLASEKPSSCSARYASHDSAFHISR